MLALLFSTKNVESSSNLKSTPQAVLQNTYWREWLPSVVRLQLLNWKLHVSANTCRQSTDGIACRTRARTYCMRYGFWMMYGMTGYICRKMSNLWCSIARTPMCPKLSGPGFINLPANVSCRVHAITAGSGVWISWRISLFRSLLLHFLQVDRCQHHRLQSFRVKHSFGDCCPQPGQPVTSIERAWSATTSVSYQSLLISFL